MRTQRDDVIAITLQTKTVVLGANQVFMETPKAWELWQLEPLMRLKRWDRKNIWWVRCAPNSE